MGFLLADCWTLWGPKQQEKKQAFFKIYFLCSTEYIHVWTTRDAWMINEQLKMITNKNSWEEIRKIQSFLRLLSDPILPPIIPTYLPTHCFSLSFLPNPLLCICFLSLHLSFSLLKQTNLTSFYSELMSHQTHLIINMPSTVSSECV